MNYLTYKQIEKTNEWMVKNARSIDLAKWNYLFYGGEKEVILDELLKYQNEDGGFGNGLEADILLPLSAAIPSAEAIFTVYDFSLDCSGKWFEKLLKYFENTIQDTPSFWQKVPKDIEEYPRAPWWNYKPDIKFSPNPCGIIASALILYGNEEQKEIGYTVATKCFEFLLSEEPCSDHDSYNIMKLIEILRSINSPLVSEDVLSKMKIRIKENVCYDESKWTEYYPQPLDFANEPNSLWYLYVNDGIDKNFEYWLSKINSEGVWMPNFSWGIASDDSRQTTENWKGYIAVKRAKIFKQYGLVQC